MIVKFLIHSTVTNTSEERTLKSELDYLSLGRTEGDLVLSDLKCSKKHALLVQDSFGRLILKDLSSTNGTRFKGRRVDEILLKVGDQFEIGDTKLRITEFLPSVKNGLVLQWPEKGDCIPRKSPNPGQSTIPSSLPRQIHK